MNYRDFHRPQGAYLRLPSETGQSFTTPSWTPGPHRPVLHEHSTHRCEGQHQSTMQRLPKHKEMTRSPNTPSLQLKEVDIPAVDARICCDISTQAPRPYVPPAFRRTAFGLIHRLSQPGTMATRQAVSKRFIWPFMRANRHHRCKRVSSVSV